MSKPLSNKLNDLVNNAAISFHVPGHKNMTIGHLDRFLSFNMDMTEITGLDDLHDPEEVILSSMENIKKHPDYTAHYLVNGTTSGILSVIQAFSLLRGKYVIPRNAHKSVFHGLDLVNGDALFLDMAISKKTNQYLGPDVSFALEYLKDSKMGILTYPNYYGECFDIQNIIRKFKQLNIPVLVDEAHGAHFDLVGFPNSSLNFGADFVVQSYHKTLPALTMGSIIFIHKNAPQRDNVLKYLSYFQTSSPSYLIMSSLENAQAFYENYDVHEFYKKRAILIETLKTKGMNVVEVEDQLKLNINCNGYSGYELQKIFENKEIYVELADVHQILLVLPLWHHEDDYPFEKLLDRIMSMDIEIRENHKLSDVHFQLERGTYYSANIEKTKWIDIDKSEHQILANYIVPYPPGIPMMFKGETITKNMIKLMNYWNDQQVRVEGIKNSKIEIKDE